MPEISIKLFSLITIAFFSFASVSAADLVIDDFTTGTFSDVITSTNSFEHLDSGSVPGGVRRAVSTASGFGNPSATHAVGGGTWSLSNSGGGISRVAISYGTDPSNIANNSDAPLNLDLSQGSQFFEIDVVSTEANPFNNTNMTSISFRLVSGVDEGNQIMTSSQVFSTSIPPITSPQTIQLSFASFGIPGFSNQIDFSDIDGIALVLDFPTGDDFVISEIRTGAAAVPEPSSSFVLAIMLGLLCRRKKL